MTDAWAVLASLRPQPFGTSRPNKVVDPIVEPQWAGIRSLAAVDDRGALLVDEAGEPIEDQPDIVEALGAARLSDGLVLDGFLTRQANQEGGGILWEADPIPTAQSSVGQLLLGTRRNRTAESIKAQEELRRASMIKPEDVVSYVAIDLLWLDGESLLRVPLLERRRLLDSVLAESDIVRVGTFVRLPIDGWIRSWRAQGFLGLTFRAANSRYEPGVASKEWATSPLPR